MSRKIDEPVRITCDKCEFYGKECHGEICYLMRILRGEDDAAD